VTDQRLGVPDGVALALGALARGDRDAAVVIYHKLAALPDVADSYRHLVRLLGARVGALTSYVPARDASHPFYQPSPSCQIAGLGALYERRFGLKRDGVFVEVGAFDGEWASNTACLADLGWSGLMIEPNPTSFALCRARHQENPGVQVVNCAAGPSEGLATLFLGEVLSTTVREQMEAYRRIPWAAGFHSGGSIEVPQARLQSLLEAWGAAPGFDLLAIDVEGGELGVMDGFDLGHWRPRAAIVELADDAAASPDRRTLEQCAEIRARFAAQGYGVGYRDAVNTVFVRDAAAA
jgi:FkbM family methyltransferase